MGCVSTASTKYPSVGAGKTRIVFSSGTTDATQTVFHTPWIEDNFWTSSFTNSSVTPTTGDNQNLLIRGGLSDLCLEIRSVFHCQSFPLATYLKGCASPVLISSYIFLGVYLEFLFLAHMFNGFPPSGLPTLYTVQYS